MNGWMKQALLILLLLALLAGCGPFPQGEGEPPLESAGIPEQTVALAQDYARLYERYVQGRDYQYGNNDVGIPIDFSFGLLHQTGLIQQYVFQDEHGEALFYAPPQSVIEELALLFFDTDIAPNGEEYSLSYGLDYDVGKPIALREIERYLNADTGEIRLTYERYYEDMFLGSKVEYAFQAQPAPEIPEALAEQIAPESMTVRFVSVTNKMQPVNEQLTETVEIATPQALLAFAETINSGTWAQNRRRYLLTADLDMAGIAFTPIGTNGNLIERWEWRDPTESGFNGEFDGQGHSIKNLRVEDIPPVEEKAYELGLFARIGPHGTVRNLTVKNAVIAAPTQWVNNYGMSAGILAGSSLGTIENCHVSGSVTGNYQVGGLIGSAGSAQEDAPTHIQNCSADVKVYGHSEVGGLIGSMHWLQVRDCTVTGEVSSVSSGDSSERPRGIGGFSGFSVAANVHNSISSVYVKTQVSSDWVGAFMGYNQGGIYGCQYDKDKSHWEAVDVIHPTETDPGVHTDLTGVSTAQAMEAIRQMRQK